MRSYTFRYINGSSAPYATLNAKDDLEFYRKLNEFLGNGNQKRLVSGSISYQERGKVADPPMQRAA